MVHEDFMGNTLKVGDDVVFMDIKYRSLSLGVVKVLTNKTVLITHEELHGWKKETRQFKSQVMLIKD